MIMQKDEYDALMAMPVKVIIRKWNPAHLMEAAVLVDSQTTTFGKQWDVVKDILAKHQLTKYYEVTVLPI